jgi:hypothetical protein
MKLNTDGLIGTIDIGPRGVDNWRECAVAVNAQGFCAEYVCSVRDEEWRIFLTQIEAALEILGKTSNDRFPRNGAWH